MMKTAFVTGATGLWGNNLTRLLVSHGVEVRALVRSADKARRQFGAMAGITLVTGDMGPTSAGRAVLDFVGGRIPGILPGSFSVVDARDVAAAQWAAAEHGRRGERYLAAGRHMTMAELLNTLASITGKAAPTRQIPTSVLYMLAGANELWARLTGRPALLSWSTARLMISENDRSHYSSVKAERKLGVRFRPTVETLADSLAWYRANGYLPALTGTLEVVPGR